LPELKQIADLLFSDFERHPVWIGVHNVDAGQPWYDDCDEETYRPWTAALPVAAEIGFVLVRASIELHDGSAYPGAVRAAAQDWDAPLRPGLPTASARYSGSDLTVLGVQQPRIFVGQRTFTFWGGQRGISQERRQAVYSALGKSPGSVFPLRFTADSQLATGLLAGRLDGFYRAVFGKAPEVEL
jgi:hypothetical protein